MSDQTRIDDITRAIKDRYGVKVAFDDIIIFLFGENEPHSDFDSMIFDVSSSNEALNNLLKLLFIALNLKTDTYKRERVRSQRVIGQLRREGPGGDLGVTALLRDLGIKEAHSETTSRVNNGGFSKDKTYHPYFFSPKYKMKKAMIGGFLNEHIEKYVAEKNKKKPNKNELRKHKTNYINAYSNLTGVPKIVKRGSSVFLKKTNPIIINSFKQRVENEKNRPKVEADLEKKIKQDEIVARNLKKAEIKRARETLVEKGLKNEKSKKNQKTQYNIMRLQKMHNGVIPISEMPETAGKRYIDRLNAAKKRRGTPSKLRVGSSKTRKNRKHKSSIKRNKNNMKKRKHVKKTKHNKKKSKRRSRRH